MEEGDREACWSQAVALGVGVGDAVLSLRGHLSMFGDIDCHGLLVGLLLSSRGWQTDAAEHPPKHRITYPLSSGGSAEVKSPDLHCEWGREGRA